MNEPIRPDAAPPPAPAEDPAADTLAETPAAHPNPQLFDDSGAATDTARAGADATVAAHSAEKSPSTLPLGRTSADTRLLTAEHAGRYRVLSRLGQGAIGVVRLAYDHHLGREVAIKELKRDNRGTAAEARFIEEARITGLLEHPGIVPVYELGKRQDGTVYYAMRRLPGRTLQDALLNQDLTARLRLLPRLIAVCQAVAFAHSRRVVHRDLKPANVMLGDFGDTLVLDWGLAKQQQGDGSADATQPSATDSVRLRSTGGHTTLQGDIMGTPAYMPPEQARGDVAHIDARSDVYALGAILYEFLTGRPPYVAPNAQLAIDQVLRGNLKSPLEFEPDAPRELVAIALHALAHDPKDRYADARAMVLDLEAFAAGGLVGAHTYRRRELLRRWLRRNLVAVTVVLVALSAALGAYRVRGHQEEGAAQAHEEKRLSLVLAKVEAQLRAAESPRGAGWYDAAAYKLISLREPAVEQRLIAALRSDKPSERRLAARALGGMGTTLAVAPLLARLAPGVETDENLVVELIMALGNIGDPSADDPVDKARRRYGQWSYVWQSTIVAFRMIEPPEIPAQLQRDANKWVDRGNALVNKQRQKEALVDFDKAIEIDPKLARAWTNRGIALRMVGDFSRALADHTQALELNPKLGAALANRAVVYKIRRQDELSLADAESHIALKDAQLANARRARANLLMRLDRFAEARNELDQALALMPKGAQTLMTLARLELAQQDPITALSWLTRAVDMSRQEVLGLRLRAIVYRQLGHDDAAKGDLDAAVALDPNEQHVLADRGALLLAQGQTATAQGDFDRAIELRGDEAEPLVERAILFYADQRQYPLAIKDMDAALQKAQPAERVWFALLREALQRQLEPAANQLSAVAVLGQIPWHDELLRVARGELAADGLLPRVRDATDRCELRLAALLSPRASALPALGEAPWRAAKRLPDPADVGCAVLRGLPAPTR